MLRLGWGSVRRIQLFEFGDLERCPASLQRALRDAMVLGATRFHTFRDVVGPLVDALKRTGRSQVLDLCSGSGGPWHDLAIAVSDAGVELDVLLSERSGSPGEDLALPATPRVSISFARQPIDARAVPRGVPGLRTLFNSFHHFRPDEAKRVVGQIAEAGEGVLIAELTARRLSSLLWNALAVPLGLLVGAAFLGDRRIRAWTYLGGLLPLVVAWDGVVSCLRSYTPEEIVALAQEAAPGHEWRHGELRLGRLPVWITYVSGVPLECSHTEPVVSPSRVRPRNR